MDGMLGKKTQAMHLFIQRHVRDFIREMYDKMLLFNHHSNDHFTGRES